MSVSGAMLRAMRISIKSVMLTELCTRTTAADQWVTTEPIYCMVEEASAATASALDYEAGNGYAYSVYLQHDQDMETTDRIDAEVGTLEVVRVTPIGTLDGVRRADCVKR